MISGENDAHGASHRSPKSKSDFTEKLRRSFMVQEHQTWVYKIGYHIVSVGIIIDSIDEKLLGLSLKKLANDMEVYRSFKIIQYCDDINKSDI